MRGSFQSGAWTTLARAGVLGAAVALAGCATGYALVQPDAAGSGAYYTSGEPYSGQGYYDDYGTGPYYPGTDGYGYYNGTGPYLNPWYWGYYGSYGYWPSFGFSVGFSNVWDFPGYWGPWYSTGWWGCGHRDCGHRHGHHHDHHGDPVTTSPRPWLKPDDPRVPPRWRHGAEPPVRVPARPAEDFATLRPLPSAGFAPHGSARMPATLPSGERYIGTPAGSVVVPRVPAGHAFTGTRAVPAGRQEVRASPPPVFRPAPASRPAPAARPAPRSADTPRTAIQ
jgi:hypothetical protein